MFFLRKIFKYGLALLLAATWVANSAYANKIKKVRIWPAPDHTRLVFELEKAVKENIFNLEKPDRLVIDLTKIGLSANLKNLPLEQTPIKNIRYAPKKGGDLRIVLDLSKKVTQTKSFLLKPNQTYGYRLVVDLFIKKQQRIEKKTPLPKPKLRNILVAIDPGHGGEDTGAIGRKGTLEKTVVLSISKKLNYMIKKQSSLDAILTRSGDYFVKLPDRVDIARNQRADLFVSVHADAYKNSRPKGASVYALSPGKASSEMAKWLADSENQSDLIGGVEGLLSLDDKDETLRGVLLDLSMTATLTDSLKAGSKMLSSLKSVNSLHRSSVEQAGFVVLKAPDVPSILVETGFISNPQEEARLRTSSYQTKMARAILNGIVNYFKSNPPPNTHFSAHNKNHYRVQKGDTLISIARKKNISALELKKFNRLNGDILYAGQVLKLPNK